MFRLLAFHARCLVFCVFSSFIWWKTKKAFENSIKMVNILYKKNSGFCNIHIYILFCVLFVLLLAFHIGWLVKIQKLQNQCWNVASSMIMHVCHMRGYSFSKECTFSKVHIMRLCRFAWRVQRRKKNISKKMHIIFLAECMFFLFISLYFVCASMRTQYMASYWNELPYSLDWEKLWHIIILPNNRRIKQRWNKQGESTAIHSATTKVGTGVFFYK